ncbi:SDR family oxidoreductase [Streptomyces sp. NPDC047002]|uniref:SDR family NAD(P)-dependent oxidoreductase n=1 Tax=Streptomyces sp. NPDC047002 TaxID=3155475 RepID=UPI0034526735
MSGVLENKVALVTGGGSGIGLAIVRRFVREGAHVFLTGRRQGPLDAAAAELGDRVTPVRADAGDPAELDALYERVRADAGRIDVLVANAGGGVAGSLGEITEKDFDAMFATNVKGPLFTLQKALPLLSPGASVIVTGSTTATRPDPGLDVYSATKAALRNLVRSWARQAKERQFRVNVLSPGPTRTPGLLGVLPEGQEEAVLDRFAAAVALGRVGDPDEIAGAALFLASPDSSYVNGADLFADGGYAQVVV